MNTMLINYISPTTGQVGFDWTQYGGTVLAIAVMVLLGMIWKGIKRGIFGENYYVACPKCEMDFVHNTRKPKPICPDCGHGFPLAEGQARFLAMMLAEFTKEKEQGLISEKEFNRRKLRAIKTMEPH